MKTHGEVWYENKLQLQDLDTLDAEKAINKIKLPQRMNNEDAAKYYNKKFFNYWVEHLTFENIKKTKNKKKAVAMLMFGHHTHTHRMGE